MTANPTKLRQQITSQLSTHRVVFVERERIEPGEMRMSRADSV